MVILLSGSELKMATAIVVVVAAADDDDEGNPQQILIYLPSVLISKMQMVI